MSGWISCFRRRKDPKLAARKAIVTLRQQLQMLEKREEYHLREVEEELKKANANIISNKPAAAAALRRKKAHETELERLSETRLTLETQVNCIESPNFDCGFRIERGPGALRAIHGKLKVDDVDKIMDSVREQMELTNEITGPISKPPELAGESRNKTEQEAEEEQELRELQAQLAL